MFFAAERTLLAWLRTGIATIGLGFVVARFGYFLTIISNKENYSPIASSVIGIALVLTGTATIALASWQHLRFVATMTEQQLPPRYLVRLTLVLTSIMVIAGFALAVYLLATAT